DEDGRRGRTPAPDRPSAPRLDPDVVGGWRRVPAAGGVVGEDRAADGERPLVADRAADAPPARSPAGDGQRGEAEPRPLEDVEHTVEVAGVDRRGARALADDPEGVARAGVEVARLVAVLTIARELQPVGAGPEEDRVLAHGAGGAARR